MIITRIRRGASRTKVLVQHNLTVSNLRSRAARISPAKATALVVMALRIAVTPVPVAKAAITGASDAEVPPSTLAAVAFAPTAAESLAIAKPALATVQVGESLDAQAAAAAAQQQAAAAAKAATVRAAQAHYAYVAALPAPIPSSDLANQLLARATAQLGADEANAMLFIAERESGVNLDSVNRSSGACGIWQALPCSKMGGMDLDHQYNWVVGYAHARYGTFVNAKAHWLEYGNW
jgi:hypothetical protein